MTSPPSPDGRKRPRGTPTFLTPVRPLKRNPIRESAAQEELVLPVSKLWIQPCRGLCKSVIIGLLLNYAGSACRFKVVGSLKKKFSSPKVAEAHILQVELPAAVAQAKDCHVSTSTVEVGLQTKFPPAPTCHIDCETELSFPLSESEDENLVVLSALFSELLLKRGITLPDDFLTYCVKAMQQLLKNNRSNVVYKLVKGIGTVRSDDSDSCFPCKRMPMGLLEYMADFFSSKRIQQVCQ